LAVSRTPRPPVNGNRTLAADLDGSGALPALPAADVLFYTVPPAAAPDPRLARWLAALQVPPRHFVYLSSSGVYGDCGGERVDETATPAPATARARRRLAAERRLGDWCAAQGVPLSILRVPGIYGPGRLGIERLEQGQPVIREAEAHPANRIHVDDLVACLLAAPGAAPGLFNVADGDYRSASWFAAEVARQAGLPPPATVSRATAERRFSAARLSFLRESRRLDTRRMHEVLGVTPRYADAADGIRASLAAG